ncbi:MAG: carbamate kinase [Bacteroidales bacterium]|jgi:carbamate kinase|nr:carbamate kinase [Bacteroidales bacterium]
MKKLAVIALGGNALIRSNEKGTYQEQINNVLRTCDSIANLLEEDYNLVIGHGNGPQVGNILLQNEAGEKKYKVEKMPLDYCVAQTQGSIGYLIDQCLSNTMVRRNINRKIVTLLTQVVVDKDDKGFINPTKPIGPYYKKEEAENYIKETGAKFKEDPKGNGWRKVVASPKPNEIENIELVKTLANEGYVVVTAGGGGIPVTNDNGYLKGVEAVIDKDLASALTAVKIEADEFYILTDVPKVYINFHKDGELALDTLTVKQAEEYLEQGQFAEGSMAPKIRAALFFVKNGGKECIITEAGQLGNKDCGTRIIR